MSDKELRDLLTGGDRRSVGKVDQAVSLIKASPSGISAAVTLMQDSDPVIAMRAADALEKATRFDPDGLSSHKRTLLGNVARKPQQEVRWHLLQMLPRLRLGPVERAEAFAIAIESLDHPSRIVVADALSAMFGLSAGDPALRKKAEQHVTRLRSSPSAAVRSRAKRLLSAR